MEKSYNMIKAQEQRIIAACIERGRYCDNTKHTVDIQYIAQRTRGALCQHGFPIFGNYDRDEKRPYCYKPQPKPEPVKVEEPKPQKVVRQTPTEQAGERMTMDDWLNADGKNRKQLQDACRHAFITKMYAELLMDMDICKMEGWDMFEYPRMMRDAVMRCFPKPKQLTLQFA